MVITFFMVGIKVTKGIRHFERVPNLQIENWADADNN